MRPAMSTQELSWRAASACGRTEWRDRQSDQIAGGRRAHRDCKKAYARPPTIIAMREPSLEVSNPEQGERGCGERAAKVVARSCDQHVRQQRHHRADQECDSHHDSIQRRPAERPAAEPEHLCLGSRCESLGRGAEQADDAIAGLAAVAYLALLA